MKNLFKFTVKDICEIAIFCALAIVLDQFVKIDIGQTGGSLNISLLPIIIICLRHGVFKGFVASGIVYSLITFLLDGYPIGTLPLDYVLGFGSICIFGLFGRHVNEMLILAKTQEENKFAYYVDIFLCMFIATLIWSTTRFFASTLSSVVNYKYTFEAAMIYNLPYVFVSAVFDLILVMVFLPFVLIINKKYKTSYLK